MTDINLLKRVFILGNYRSGTSLLRIILNNHSRISAPPESGFLQWWHKKFGNWNENYNIKDVNNFISNLMLSKKIETWNLNRDLLTREIIKNKPLSYGELISIVYSYYGLQNDKNVSVIIDKNNYYVDYLNLLKSVWKDAQYIMIIRDGRDVACSYRDLKQLKTNSPYRPELPFNIDEIAYQWRDNNQKILNFFNLNKNCKKIIIRYEDLILNLESELHKLCDFLDLEIERRMTHYYENHEKNFLEPDLTFDWKKKTRESPDKNNIGKYKDQLSTFEIHQFNSIGSNLLKKFNYIL